MTRLRNSKLGGVKGSEFKNFQLKKPSERIFQKVFDFLKKLNSF